MITSTNDWYYWFAVAYYDYTNSLKTNSQFISTRAAIDYIWRFYLNRPKSRALMHNKHYRKISHLAVIGFENYKNKKCLIRTHYNRYLWVPTESNWYKKRRVNALREAVFEGIEDTPDNFFDSPIQKLARFQTFKNTWGGFEHCLIMREDMVVDKKIDDKNLLKTESFFGKSLDKTLEETDLKKYNLDQYKIKGNGFTNINKMIKASEHAFFLYDNQNAINETFVSEVGKKSV